jgi:ribosomal-protein-alanine N-acetyltransferase
LDPLPPILLETPRLVLRAARADHADTVFAVYTGREDASQFLQRTAHQSVEQTAAVLTNWGEANWPTTTRYVWSILSRPDEQPIGLFLLFVDGCTAEIHYGLGPEHWGQGLATEAGAAVMNWIRDQSLLDTISTTCAAGHAASLRVLDKIGLSRIELLPETLFLSAKSARVDAWLYRWMRR